VVVIAGRLLRATDRTFGEAIVHRQVEKYRAILVEELSRPVVLAALDVTENALVKGHYGTAVARALESKREDIAAHVVDQMRKDTALSLLLRTPGIGPALERLPDRALAGVADTLGTREMDAAIRAVIREVLRDLRAEVAKRDWGRAAAA
jgi:voltage-gated potassium channel